MLQGIYRMGSRNHISQPRIQTRDWNRALSSIPVQTWPSSGTSSTSMATLIGNNLSKVSRTLRKSDFFLSGSTEDCPPWWFPWSGSVGICSWSRDWAPSAPKSLAADEQTPGRAVRAPPRKPQLKAFYPKIIARDLEFQK